MDFGTASRLSSSGDEVGAAVDIDEFAGHAPGEGRREIGAGIAYVHDVDELAKRRLVGSLVKHELEILQARRGPSLERARRDRVHPDALRPKFVGEIAADRLKRRLDRA